MSRTVRHGRYAVLVALTLTTAACGGGSGGGKTAKSDTPRALSSTAASSTPAAASSADPNASSQSSAPSPADSAAASAGCDKATSDKAAAAVKAAVGGPPMITSVEIMTGCLEATISTALPPDGGTAAVKLCDKAATVAYAKSVLGIAVYSAEKKLLATGLRGDLGCKLEN